MHHIYNRERERERERVIVLCREGEGGMKGGEGREREMRWNLSTILATRHTHMISVYMSDTFPIYL